MPCSVGSKQRSRTLTQRTSRRCERGQDLAQKSYYAALNESIDNVSGDPALEAVARAYRKCSDFILRMASYHRT